MLENIKSDVLFINRLGKSPTGELICRIMKSKLRQLGIDEKGFAIHLRHLFHHDLHTTRIWKGCKEFDLRAAEYLQGISLLRTYFD